jgi:hypothetical protein
MIEKADASLVVEPLAAMHDFQDRTVLINGCHSQVVSPPIQNFACHDSVFDARIDKFSIQSLASRRRQSLPTTPQCRQPRKVDWIVG